MAKYWPTPGFKGRALKLCVLTRWDFNFCVRSSPLRGRKIDISMIPLRYYRTEPSAQACNSSSGFEIQSSVQDGIYVFGRSNMPAVSVSSSSTLQIKPLVTVALHTSLSARSFPLTQAYHGQCFHRSLQMNVEHCRCARLGFPFNFHFSQRAHWIQKIQTDSKAKENTLHAILLTLTLSRKRPSTQTGLKINK